MQCAVQRRSIYLAPPGTMDRHWIAREFSKPHIYEMFGFNSPASMLIGNRVRDDLIVGAIRLTSHQVRIGFALMFPPTDLVEFWEFGYAITEPKHRNAFNAVNAMDAMAHYTLDLMGLPLVGGRTREDNRAAAAIALRSGHKPLYTRQWDGHTYTFYTLDQAGWAKRKEKLERGEKEHPYTGAVFHVMESPPYIPVQPQGAAPGDTGA
ncbi:MAG: GNAT family N-acetyltransferase [Myxococcota bacterium]